MVCVSEIENIEKPESRFLTRVYISYRTRLNICNFTKINELATYNSIHAGTGKTNHLQPLKSFVFNCLCRLVVLTGM